MPKMYDHRLVVGRLFAVLVFFGLTHGTPASALPLPVIAHNASAFALQFHLELDVTDPVNSVIGVGVPCDFEPNESWTRGAYYGSRGTYFADVTGDGRADAIVVNNDTVTVRRSTGSSFTGNEDWTRGAYYGSRNTMFADATGDRRADAIVVNDDGVTVRRSR
jgi:hypothetical protein